jgi:transposase-like protein
MPSVCTRCPQCGSTEVRSTLRTTLGSYCRCAQCGHAWHDDAGGRAAAAVECFETHTLPTAGNKAP